MKCFVVLSVLACLLAVVCASSYYAQAARGGRRSPAARRPAPRSAALVSGNADENNEQPTPYQFNYSVDDPETGSKQERQEEGDENGAIKGQYSYMGPDGIYRTVSYVADENGYRASVSSNEPGLGSTENPADVVMDVQSPPAGAYDAPRKANKKKKARNYY